MKLTEFVEQRRRMCCTFDCADCPFYPYTAKNSVLSISTRCKEFCLSEPLVAISLLQEWLAENPQLDSCPFCGSDAAFHSDGGRYGVMCKESGCAILSCVNDTKAEAAEKWNKRAVK